MQDCVSVLHHPGKAHLLAWGSRALCRQVVRQGRRVGVPGGLDKQVQAMRPLLKEEPGVIDGSRFLDTSLEKGQKHWVTETHIKSEAQLGTWAGNTVLRQVLLIMINNESYYYLSGTFCVPDTVLRTFICATDI